MVFPVTKLPLVSELLIGSTWTPFARLIESGLTITRARQDWSSRAVASRCSQAVLNPTGVYSNRLPTSPNYGLLGPGTELRHRIELIADDFTSDVANSWGSTPGGLVWSSFGAGGTVNASDFQRAAGVATVSIPVASAYRASYLAGTSYTDVEARVEFDAVPTVIGGGPLEPAGIMLRGTSTSSYYLVRCTIETSNAMKLQIYSPAGTTLADAVIAGVTWDGSPMVLSASIQGRSVRAKLWHLGSPEPSSWHAVAWDAVTVPGPGWVGVRGGVGAGNANTKPVVFTYDNFKINDFRFWGELSKTAPAWDLSGKKVTAQFDAAGVLEGLSDNTPPKLSALRRTILHQSPVSYWPLEDESGTTQLASALSEAPAITGAFRSTTGAVATAAGISTLAGSAPVISMAQGSQIVMDVPQYADGGSFSLHIPMYINSATSPGWYVYLTHANGVLTTLLVDPAIPRISGDSSTSTTVLWIQNDVGPSLADLTGQWMMTDLYATSAGSWNFNIRNSAGTILRNLIGTSAAAYANITKIMIRAVDGGGDLTPVGVGHVALYNYPASVTLPCAAMAGHTRETAKERMTRVCAEVGVAFIFMGSGDGTALVGAQPTDTTPEILFRAAEADQGILYEPRDMFGLAYRPLHSLYNQTAIQLDYAAAQVAEPFLPTDDRQLTANDVIARRYSGSFARAVQTSGPLGTATIGDRLEDKPWNVAADSQLPDVAGWRKHLGTWDEARYPAVSVNFAAPAVAGDQALTNALAACDIGDAITIVNLPLWQPQDPVSLLAQGTTEWFGDGKEWKASFNAVPAGPFEVFTVADQVHGRIMNDPSALAAAATSTATSLTVGMTTVDGKPWITTANRPGDFPFDVGAAGERVRVTAVASALLDGFGRTLGSGWGSADTGQAYTLNQAAGSYAVSGGKGLIGAGTAGTEYTASIADIGANVDILVWFTPGLVASGAQVEQKIRVRHNGSTWYEANVQYQTSGQIDFYLNRGVTVLTSAGSALAYSAVMTVAARIQAIGSSIRAKVWDVSVAEPQAWKLSATDTGYAGAATDSVMLVADRIVGNTQTGWAASFDTLIADSPQTFTVTRSINGVVKAQTADAPVTLWRPAALAL